MSGIVQVHSEADAVVVCIPLKLRKRSTQRRRLLVGAREKSAKPIASHEHATILKALGRAYRWKRMLESGEFASIADLADAETINHTYVRRILRLTLLSPEITEAVLDGALQSSVRLEDLLVVFSDLWLGQTWWVQQGPKYMALCRASPEQNPEAKSGAAKALPNEGD